MNTKEPHELLHEVVQKYGTNILGEDRLKGMLSDIMPNIEKKYQRVINQAVVERIGIRLIELENEHLSIRIIKIESLRDNFKKNNGLNSTADYIVDSFLYALGWNEVPNLEQYNQIDVDPISVLDEQINIALIDGILNKDESKALFDKGKQLGFSEIEIADIIDSKIKSHKLKPLPNTPKSLKDLKDIICASDWLTDSKYKLINKPAPIAPSVVDPLIELNEQVNMAFIDGVLSINESKALFTKGLQLRISETDIANNINSKIRSNNLKPFPDTPKSLKTQREIICSSDWISESEYNLKKKNQNQPPPKPFPKSVVVVSLLFLVLTGGFLVNIFYFKPLKRDREAPRYYSFADNVIFRSSQVSGVEHNKISTLPYGTELITYDFGTEWAYGKIDGKEGYISTKLLLNKKDFYLLNSIFGDVESKNVIETAKCRKALLKYFKDKNLIGKMDTTIQREVFGNQQPLKEVWQVFAKGKDIKPNSVFFSRIFDPHSKYTDFAVVLKNIISGNRRLLIFNFSDTEEAILIDDEPAPALGDILSIQKMTGGFINVRYSGF